MSKRLHLLIIALLVLTSASAQDTFNQIGPTGNISQRNENSNFNKHNTDSTRNKEIPKGYHVWRIDKKFGNVIPALPDTMPHLFMNTTFNSGTYGEYNHIGNNYSARLSRIFANRAVDNDDFLFTAPYSFVEKKADQFLFMNTLSPFTNILYDNCGDKTNGEDHIDGKFAINAGKRFNVGFDLDYAYGRGYFSNQSTSHFNATIFSSYLGDRYNMHFFFNTAHMKTAENGGIADDEHIIHPESFTESYADNEIGTILASNWNRNDHQTIFFSHRYNIGFYRMVKMTEEELKARKFAEESRKDKEKREQQKDGLQEGNAPKGRNPKDASAAPKGRPEGAIVMGKEPGRDSLNVAVADTTRIKVDGQAAIDSLNRAQAIQDSINATMKREYVPVTSIIHTFEWNRNKRIYQAYQTPKNYYLNRYYDKGPEYGNDSIYDQARQSQLKNTFGLALLEGFNKYMKAGLKGFVTHEYRSFEMPDTVGLTGVLQKWSEHNVSVGGQLSKTQGKTLHFNLQAEFWLAGADAGQMRADFSTDLNFPLFGDTVRLAASAFLHRNNPSFFQRKYHSKHFWWDNDDMAKETRARIEGIFSYDKTNTKVRVAVEQIKNYTYFGMSYTATSVDRTKMTAAVYQETGGINILTAQLHQNFRLGPLNWENIITYQNSSNKDVLPLPTWNFFTNLYLKFKIARVLGVELGADATYFTKYYAPDFCPGINQFAIQQNADSRVELGGYPFVDVYANMVLKGVRFFVMMSHVNNGSGNRMKFLTPHYPTNGSVLHLGVSWNFFN